MTVNGLGKPVAGAVDGDLRLLHALEQGRLGLRAGSVDLVADDEVREHRAGLELELAGRLVVDRDAGDVGGQQVGRELDAAHRAVDAAGERAGQHRLADAGHVLDEQVALGEQHGHRDLDGLALSVDDGLDGGHDGARVEEEFCDRERCVRVVGNDSGFLADGEGVHWVSLPRDSRISQTWFRTPRAPRAARPRSPRSTPRCCRAGTCPRPPVAPACARRAGRGRRPVPRARGRSRPGVLRPSP